MRTLAPFGLLILVSVIALIQSQTHSATEFLSMVALIIFAILYGLFWVLVWLLPFILIGGALFLAAIFIRKLVLDAVREAHKQ